MASYRCLLIANLTLLCVLAAEAPAPRVTPDDIERATCSLRVWQVLGWDYHRASSHVWERGEEETARSGHATRRTTPPGDVRAVALGVEAQHLVLLTLRSLVDPTYPNLHIQGVSTPIRDTTQKRIDFGQPELNRRDWIRYGHVQATWYRHLGGGSLAVSHQAIGVSECPQGNPTAYEPISAWSPWKSYPQEVIDGATFTRPHESVGVADHFAWQRLHQQPVVIRTIGQHDVALLYLPLALFAGEAQPPTLGLQSPTAAVEVLLNRSRDLFGFDMVLVGKATMDQVRGYRPTPQEVFPGTVSLTMAIDLVLGTQTLTMLQSLDRLLVEYLPSGEAITNFEHSLTAVIGIDPALLRKMGLSLIGLL